jgi:hypothetical protein
MTHRWFWIVNDLCQRYHRRLIPAGRASRNGLETGWCVDDRALTANRAGSGPGVAFGCIGARSSTYLLDKVTR